jgi:MFS family permease
MIFLGWAVGSPAWGWFSDYIQRRCLPLIIGAIGSFVLICVLLYIPDLPEAIVYITLFLFGLLSSVQIIVFAICHEASKMKVAGTAIALTNMIVMIGGNVFQPLIGKLLDLSWTHHMVAGARVYPIYAYQLALSVIPVSLVIAAIIATLFIKETYCSMSVMEH